MRVKNRTKTYDYELICMTCTTNNWTREEAGLRCNHCFKISPAPSWETKEAEVDINELFLKKQDELIEAEQKLALAKEALATSDPGDNIIETANYNRSVRQSFQAGETLAAIATLDQLVQSNKRGLVQVYLPELQLSIRYGWGGWSETDEINSAFEPATIDNVFAGEDETMS